MAFAATNLQILNIVTKTTSVIGFIGVMSMFYVIRADLDDLAESSKFQKPYREIAFGNHIY